MAGKIFGTFYFVVVTLLTGSTSVACATSLDDGTGTARQFVGMILLVLVAIATGIAATICLVGLVTEVVLNTIEARNNNAKLAEQANNGESKEDANNK